MATVTANPEFAPHAASLSGRRMVRAAITREPIERPAWVPLVGVHGASLINESAGRYLQSADLIERGLRRAVELYQPDGLPIAFDLQLEAEVLGCELAWAERTPPSVASHPMSLMEGPGLSLEDLPTFDVAAGRLPVVLDVARRMRRTYGDDLALYGLVMGPFTLATHLLGNDIFLAMFDDGKKVQDVIAFCADVAIDVAAAYTDAGADVIAVVDPMTSQISPEHFEQFVTPDVDRVFDALRARGALSSLFVCGDATRNLGVMCRTRCDNVSVDENIPLADLQSIARANHKSVGGNLKLTTVLLMGQPLDAAHDALRCMDRCGSTGFVLAPGCDLPYDVPPENLQAVSRVVHDAYQRQVARATFPASDSAAAVVDITLPDYTTGTPVVDVITLDSAACAPCQYMVGAVRKAIARLGIDVPVHERKITTPEGVAFMSRLGVTNLPTICISGKPAFVSTIPSIDVLCAALADARQEQAT